jgi:LEA14-like dessication related protein
MPQLGKLKDLLPEATFETFKVKDIDFQGLDSVFVFQIDNPYPVGLELEAMNWKLGLANHDFLDGSKDKKIDIDPNASSPVRVPVSLKFEDVFKVAKDAKGAGEVPWAFTGDFTFKTPIGPVTLPFQQRGVMPTLSAPKISLKALRVGKLDLKTQTASLELDLGIATEQSSPLTFSKFGYGIKLAGTEVASGNAKIDAVEGSSTMTLPFDIKLLELGATIVEAVTKKTELKVRLNADAQVQTPLGPVPLAINEVTNLSLK